VSNFRHTSVGQVTTLSLEEYRRLLSASLIGSYDLMTWLMRSCQKCDECA